MFTKIIASIILVIFLIRLSCCAEKGHIKITDVVVFILAAVLVLADMPNAEYQRGWHDAIHSANLIDVGYDTYLIEYDGEVHEYFFN